MFEVRQHGLKKSLLVDERDEDDGLPVLLLAVEVAVEIFRIVIDDWRRLVEHQALQTLKLNDLFGLTKI